MRLLFLMTALILLGCQDDCRLDGTWSVHQVYYGNEDISGIDRNHKVRGSARMFIDHSKNVIFLPTIDLENNDQGKFECYRIGNSEYIRIYNATDERFNGEYTINLQEIDPTYKGGSHYLLELESDSIFIEAEIFQ